MTIATVVQGRRSLTIHLGELTQRTPGGEAIERYRALWAQEREHGRIEVLLGGPGQQIAAGVKGLERCIRVVVDRYGRAEDCCELEFALHEMRNRKERHRLLAMAGGLIAGARMTPEERKGRAIKAAMARYEDCEAYEEEAVDGTVVRCWGEYIGPRHWVVICTVDGVEQLRHDCRSQREVNSWRSWGELVVRLKKLMKEQAHEIQ